MEIKNVPTKTTAKQIEKLCSQIRTALKKEKFDGRLFSKVITSTYCRLTEDFIKSVKERVKTVRIPSYHRVKVDRTVEPEKMLRKAVNWEFINTIVSDTSILESIPRGTGEEVEVCFFMVNGNFTDDEIERECKKRKLIPADPYSIVAVNMEDPGFAEDKVLSTHWKGVDGVWYRADFWRARARSLEMYGKFKISICKDLIFYRPGTWFAGIKKP